MWETNADLGRIRLTALTVISKAANMRLTKILAGLIILCGYESSPRRN